MLVPEPQGEREKLLEQIRVAERAYRAAAVKAKHVSEDFQGLDYRERPAEAPDGTFARHHAARTETLALREYREALKAFTDFSNRIKPSGQSLDELTPRERDVLKLIGSGQSTKEIAFTLGISFKTAACHRGRILSKLNARNTADLTRAAIRLGLIEP